MSDLISRADAIAFINSGISLDTDADREYATEMLKNIPSAELPKSDLISRADAIEAVHKYFVKEIDKTPHEIDEDGFDVYTDMPTVNSLFACNKELSKELKALPSADAEQVTGKLNNPCDSLLTGDSDECKEHQSKLESAEAVQGWIPCSERLPETHTEYVIENPWTQVSITKDTYQLSNPVLGYGKRKYHSDDDPMMSVVWYEDDGYDRTAWITAPDCEDIDVIAWMPLPTPYKGGDDK